MKLQVGGNGVSNKGWRWSSDKNIASQCFDCGSSIKLGAKSTCLRSLSLMLQRINHQAQARKKSIARNSFHLHHHFFPFHRLLHRFLLDFLFILHQSAFLVLVQALRIGSLLPDTQSIRKMFMFRNHYHHHHRWRLPHDFPWMQIKSSSGGMFFLTCASSLKNSLMMLRQLPHATCE